MTTTAAVTTRTARSTAPAIRVVLFLGAAFGLSAVYTVLTTLVGSAPPDFDATTLVVWVGYAGGALAIALALRQERWARWAVTLMVTSFLAGAVPVYPHYFTAPYQDTAGWLEAYAYVAFLALALHENLRRPASS
jgi:peptidoglycan/LPS O-acetylase OafA/YrhL